jgi:hypothetical protein
MQNKTHGEQNIKSLNQDRSATALCQAILESKIKERKSAILILS